MLLQGWQVVYIGIVYVKNVPRVRFVSVKILQKVCDEDVIR